MVPSDILAKLQSYYHSVIKGRVNGLSEAMNLRIPELTLLLKLEIPEMWFSVPGMYGGFSYRLETEEGWLQLDNRVSQTDFISVQAVTMCVPKRVSIKY